MTGELAQAACRGCGKPILFAKVEGMPDKVVPLDPRPPVYEVQGFFDDHGRSVTVVRRHFKAFVSHFATCAKANDFSASKKT